MAENAIVKKHKIKYTYGESLEIQGVQSVIDYTDTVINIKLSDCYLTVKGEGFKVQLLNVESGELNVSGRITSFAYSKSREKQSLLKRFTK